MIKKCYCGFINESKKLMRTSSGGAATILAEEFIKNGGIVIGVKWAADYRSCLFKLVKNVFDIEEITGTKYLSPRYKIEVDNIELDLFSTVQKYLNLSYRVLFFGLGCYVGALLAYLNQKNTNTDGFYTADILCHGPALDEVHIKFIEELENKNKSKIVKLNHRYKKEKWMPKYIKAEFENGKTIIEEFNDTSFGIAFHQFAKTQCSNCKFKGEKHNGDICIGDYWGSNPQIKGYNEKGTSLVFVQKEKGFKLLDILKKSECFELFETDYAFATKHNPMYNHSRNSNGNLNKFKSLLKKYSLEKSLKKINFSRRFLSLVKKPLLLFWRLFVKD